MLHKIKEIYELYNQSRLDEIRELAIYADRLGMQDVADKIFALHFEIKKSLAKSSSIFLGLRKIIRTVEIAARTEDNEETISRENTISEIRFCKSFPITLISDKSAETEANQV